MTKQFTSLIAAFALAMLLTGCSKAQVGNSLTETTAGSDPGSQLEFWHVLATRSITSNDEALHGLLLFLDGKDDAADYAGRVQTLKSRNILPESFDAPANEGVTRGNMAVALCNALEIKGGAVMRVFGTSQRYAVRELQYLNVYPASSPQQTFRGNEFVYLIGRAEDYLRIKGVESGETAPHSKPGEKITGAS